MRRIVSFVTLALLTFAVTVHYCAVCEARTVSGWTRIFEGVESAWGTDTSPRLMRAWAMRVSLRNPDVSVYASHSNGGLPYETTRQTTPAFLTDHAMEIAVNANLFALTSPETDVYGLVISNGTVVSPAQSGTFSSQLRFTSEKVASLVSSGTTPTGIYNAVGGAEIVLQNGSNIATNPDINPRTGIGISADGEYMIIVVVDGRQPGWSEGVNQHELGDWLLDFGAYDAANFDGGGSTCLVQSSGGGGYNILNSPSDGTPRAVGSNLGVNTSGATNQGPSAVGTSSGRVDLVVRGNMDRIYHKYYASGAWSGWEDIDGWTALAPAISYLGNNRWDVFVLGDDNAYWQKTYSNGGWSGWSSRGGGFTSAPAAIADAAANVIQLFGRGTNNSLYQSYWNGSTWTAWTNLGGTMTSEPSVTTWGSGRWDVFARGSDNAIWQKTYNGGWSGWTSRGGSFTSAPAAVSWGANRIDLFGRGDDNAIWHCYWNGSTWSSWEDLGGTAASDPTVCSRGVGLLDVYIRTNNDHVYQKSYNAGWSGWNDVGYSF